MVSGVEVITIGEGVIVYQCEEGLVPEGRVEAMCGVDGRWSPDPTQLMCRININLNTTATTAATATTATTTTIAATSTTGMTCPCQGIRYGFRAHLFLFELYWVWSGERTT